MADVLIRAPAPGDAAALAADLRDQDAAELAAAGVRDARAVIEQSVRASTKCWTAEADGRLLCIFGVTPLDLLGGLGAPWLLGTPALLQHRRAVVALTPRYIEQMLRGYSHLLNHVHTDNTVSRAWLRRVGFTEHPAQPHPRTGAPFHPFEMRA